MCDCAQVIEADGIVSVGHTEECRADRLRARDKALAADARERAEHQEAMAMLASLTPRQVAAMLKGVR